MCISVCCFEKIGVFLVLLSKEQRYLRILCKVCLCVSVGFHSCMPLMRETTSQKAHTFGGILRNVHRLLERHGLDGT